MYLERFKSKRFSLIAAMGLALGGCMSNPMVPQQTAQQNMALQKLYAERLKAAGIPVHLQQQAQKEANVQKKPETVLKGYAKDFEPVHKLMQKGNLDLALAFYEHDKDKLEELKRVLGKEPEKLDPESNRLKMLYQVEYGTLALSNNSLEEAQKSYRKARDILGIREDEGKITSSLKEGASGLFSFVSGNEELKPYEMPGYESVLMLNHLALSYLLDGSEKAYNVSRMAIDWQNLQKKSFEKRIKEAHKKAQEKKSSAGSKAGALGKAEEEFSRAYSYYDAEASKVASAYVNPFGYYMSGVVMELDAYSDPSSLDDAKRAFENASKLNPDSKLLKEAAQAMKKALDKGVDKKKRVVHVVVGEGFAPYVRVMVRKFAVDKNIVTLQMPILTPVDSKVAKVQIEDKSGHTLAVLDTVTDIQAIAMRHQKDSKPALTLRLFMQMLGSGLRDSVMSKLGGFGRMLGQAYEDKVATPDARSWLTLPRTLRAARLELPRKDVSLYLVTLDKNGKVLSRQPIELGHDNQFVYARAVDNHLWVHKAKKIWSN